MYTILLQYDVTASWFQQCWPGNDLHLMPVAVSLATVGRRSPDRLSPENRPPHSEAGPRICHRTTGELF
jgi:hypothetical protein